MKLPTNSGGFSPSIMKKPKGLTMTNSEYRKSPEFMKEISFKELVKAIDEKWSHTYESVLDLDYEEYMEEVEQTNQ
jgi:hypothetical protein